MIELKNVSTFYGGTVKAVNSISLQVSDGEIFGLFGPNGAGKTTTIKMMTGILVPTSGDISVNGVSIKEESAEVKRMIGFVPDAPNMFLSLKGIEYLNFMADMYDVSLCDRKERIEVLSKRLEMSSVLRDPIQSYSHGMRKKIEIIGVLVHNPSVWIMDEPMTGLDPRSSYLITEMMREHVNDQKTVFISTQSLDVAEKICDRVAIIHNGQIVFCGNIDELKEHFQKQEARNSVS